MTTALEQPSQPRFDTIALHGGFAGDPATNARAARVQLLRDTGAALSPFNAWLLQGLERLGVVSTGTSPTRRPSPSSSWHIRALHPSRILLTFRVIGDCAETKRAIDRLKLFSLLANVGDAKSLVIHPASTTHQQLTPEERSRSAVDESTIRLSIGIEDKRDIIADLEQALA